MKFFHLFLCLALITLLIWLNRVFVPEDTAAFGGLSWIGWASILLIGVVIGFVAIFKDSARAFGFFRSSDENAAPLFNVRTLTPPELKELGLDKYRGPTYPHPVIFPERCIGCQACVDACPHDVLAIVDGTASAIAPDLCMEDTACQAECPVNPKACIIINTTKEVRSMPTPTRDGATFETNVPGCFIIGDVSGVPLIKNAVKEGADVIAKIAADLQNAGPEPKAEYDVAIIGIGPGGASAAASAAERNLRYIGIEQGKTLSTIDLYPKGKYIFFKPDTKDWFGGISVAGLGLAKAKYGAAVDDDAPVIEALGAQLADAVHAQSPQLHDEMIARIPNALRADLSPQLTEKIEKELKKRIVTFLRTKGQGDWPSVFQKHFIPQSESLFSNFKSEISDQLQTKIPGDQRENILDIWLGNLADRGVVINENESCKTVTKADDGDYFTVTTERDPGKVPQTYRARRVIIAIGLRGAPNKLRLKDEETMTFKMEGKDRQKVLYGLSEPAEFWGTRIVVVGGGNVAVEAAVDLVAIRDGASISYRPPETMNQVTMLVRDYLAPTVKFGNKYQLYQCADDGVIDLRFGVGIKELRENEVVLEDVKTKTELGTIPNDFVFALIGGERPNRFLESIGITIK